MGWILPDAEPRVFVDKQQGDKKSMLVVFFSTSGFKVIRFVPDGATVTSEYCIKLFQEIVAGTHSPTWVHMDNARPHKAKCTERAMKEMGLVPLPHPPYSPDLAPSDFWFFGYLKGKLGTTDSLLRKNYRMLLKM